MLAEEVLGDPAYSRPAVQRPVSPRPGFRELQQELEELGGPVNIALRDLGKPSYKQTILTCSTTVRGCSLERMSFDTDQVFRKRHISKRLKIVVSVSGFTGLT